MAADVSLIIQHDAGEDKMRVEAVISPAGGGLCKHEAAFIAALKECIRGLMNKHNVLVLNDKAMRELAPILDKRLEAQGAGFTVEELLERNQNYIKEECVPPRSPKETLEASTSDDVAIESGKRILH